MSKSAELTNKLVLITGAGGFLGVATAKQLLKSGCKVCLTDNDEITLQRVYKELSPIYGERVISIKCDVTTNKSISDAMDFCIKTFGGMDILVNSHGILDEGNFELVIDVNLTGVMRTTMLAIERMRKDKKGRGGQILSVASAAGLVESLISSYSASKAGVIHFTRCIGHEFHEQATGVSVMCIAPSFLTTPMKNMEDPSALKETLYFEGALETFELTRGVMSAHVSAAEVAEEIIKMLREDQSGCVKAFSSKGIKRIEVQVAMKDI